REDPPVVPVHLEPGNLRTARRRPRRLRYEPRLVQKLVAGEGVLGDPPPALQPERDGAAGPPGVFLSRHVPAPRFELGGDVGLDHLRRFPPVLPREEVVPPRPPARITGDRGEPEIGHLDRGPGPAVAIGERVQLLDDPEAAAGRRVDAGALRLA